MAGELGDCEEIGKRIIVRIGALSGLEMSSVDFRRRKYL